MEKRKKGDVFRNAIAEGSAARARAPISDFAMIGVMSGVVQWAIVVRLAIAKLRPDACLAWHPNFSRGAMTRARESGSEFDS